MCGRRPNRRAERAHQDLLLADIVIDDERDAPALGRDHREREVRARLRLGIGGHAEERGERHH